MMIAYTFSDCDKFLESLKTIDSESVNVLLEPYRIWIGYTERGSIIIQEFKTMDELLSMFISFRKFRGKRYTDFIEPILCNLGKTAEDILYEFLYTEKNR